jgi:hypothetical protein
MTTGIKTPVNNTRKDRESNNKRLPNLTDFPIRFPGNPKYIEGQILETNPLEVIVQKLEMILLTNTGEVLGDSFFGANLEYYLWETEASTDTIYNEINRQIRTYVPELATMGYSLDIDLVEGNYRDIMQLYFTIKGYNFIYIWA